MADMVPLEAGTTLLARQQHSHMVHPVASMVASPMHEVAH